MKHEKIEISADVWLVGGDEKATKALAEVLANQMVAMNPVADEKPEARAVRLAGIQATILNGLTVKATTSLEADLPETHEEIMHDLKKSEQEIVGAAWKAAKARCKTNRQDEARSALIKATLEANPVALKIGALMTPPPAKAKGK